MRFPILAAAVLWAGFSFALTEGWNDINPARKEILPQNVLWTADFASVRLDCRDGADGTLRIVEQGGRRKLEITKKNEVGYLLVTAPAFDVEKNAKLRTSAYCECSDGDSEEGGAYLRLWGKQEDLSYFKGLDGRGPGGPRMDKMLNAAPGMRIRKLAHRLADAETGTSITPAIVVSGPRSTSVWSDWCVEDFVVAKNAWTTYCKTLEPPTVDFGMQDENGFAEALAHDSDHTATLARDGEFTKLRIDGKDVPPMIFKGRVQKDGRITYAGGLHDKEGLNLQCVSLRFGRTEKNPLGLWSKDGFDVALGVDLVRKAMRLAPNSVFILQLELDAYPEWCERHPGEAWRLADGRKVYGQHVHADFHIESTLPKDRWYWPSYHSLDWRRDVKDCITELVAELKRTGLSKRIVGVHLSGYHDAQFSTRHPDFSASAVCAFTDWQRMKFGEVKWHGAPVFGDARYFDPEKDSHQLAYLTFIKQGPFHMQEDFARHIRGCFGKEIVIGRYCMGWGTAAFNAALDLDPFVLSKDIDFLVTQPDYSRRVPGVAIGSRIPTQSFHHHGKLLVNEFDLRTYGGVNGESELRVLGLSQATDFPMWQSIHRKLAGMTIAQRMGWWYLDMSGNWFSPPEIAQDIGLIHSQLLDAESLGDAHAEWHPSVAIAVDEAGMLQRNSIGHYYDTDAAALQRQVHVFAGSGVPYDSWLADDFVREPKLAMRYKVIVLSDMHYQDSARRDLLKRLAEAGVTRIFIDSSRRLSAAEFATIVRESGGYVPTRDGLQVNMNNCFISLHALKGGKYEFSLPFRCAVYNMKSGLREANGEKLMLDVLAGETCWFRIREYELQAE